MNEQQTTENKPSAPEQKPNASKDLFEFDKKTIETIKWSAVFAAVTGLIDGLGSAITSSIVLKQLAAPMMGAWGYYGDYTYGFGSVASTVLSNAIYGAIFGFIIAKFYPTLMSWQKKYLGNKLNNLFKLLFWPGALGAAIGIVFVAPFGFFVLGFASIIILAVTIFSRFVYAKGMEQMAGKYYK